MNVPIENWVDESAFDQPFLNAAIQEGTARTGVFGMRLMWRDFDNLRERLHILYPGCSNDSDLLQNAFGPIQFLHLSRKDKVAQAVSHVKAEQSGLWHVDTNGVERERIKSEQTSHYDAGVLSKQAAECERHDAAWVNWFAIQNIQPVKITYESLSENPQSTLATILSVLGQDPTIAGTVKPRTIKLANKESLEWAARFRSEVPAQ